MIITIDIKTVSNVFCCAWQDFGLWFLVLGNCLVRSLKCHSWSIRIANQLAGISAPKSPELIPIEQSSNNEPIEAQEEQKVDSQPKQKLQSSDSDKLSYYQYRMWCSICQEKQTHTPCISFCMFCI